MQLDEKAYAVARAQVAVASAFLADGAARGVRWLSRYSHAIFTEGSPIPTHRCEGWASVLAARKVGAALHAYRPSCMPLVHVEEFGLNLPKSRRYP